MKVKDKKYYCKECGKEFIKYNSLQKCCSAKCQTKLDKVKEKEKKAKIKERKKVSFSVLVEVLDKLVSQYIRQKYSKDGICECISCGIKKPIAEMHNAHFIKRGVRKYRFEEDNLAPACPKCNLFDKENHLLFYTIKQIERLGKNKVDEMMKEAREVGKKPSIQELQEKIEFYKLKLKEYETNINR